jgi:hypothetical protein
MQMNLSTLGSDDASYPSEWCPPQHFVAPSNQHTIHVNVGGPPLPALIMRNNERMPHYNDRLLVTVTSHVVNNPIGR